MPRPRKRRRLWRDPQAAVFKPVGVPLESLPQIILHHEELEALRLADVDGHHQTEAARQMGVSRSTFQRILTEARRKVAQALVQEAALLVEGGTFRLAGPDWHCSDCGHDWQITHGSGAGPPDRCPACDSINIREKRRNQRRHLD